MPEKKRKLHNEPATLIDAEREELYEGSDQPIRAHHKRAAEQDDLANTFPVLRASPVVIVSSRMSSARLVACGNGWLAYYMS